MEESQGRQYALVASGNPTATFPIPLYLIMLNPIIITKRTVFGIIVRIEEIEYPFFRCSIRRTDGQHAIARARKSFFSEEQVGREMAMVHLLAESRRTAAAQAWMRSPQSSQAIDAQQKAALMNAAAAAENEAMISEIPDIAISL